MSKKEFELGEVAVNQKTHENVTACFESTRKLIRLSSVSSAWLTVALIFLAVFGGKFRFSNNVQIWITAGTWIIWFTGCMCGYIFRWMNMKSLKKAQQCVMTCSVGSDLSPYASRIAKMRKALLWDAVFAWTPFRYFTSIWFAFHYRAFKKELSALKTVEG